MLHPTSLPDGRIGGAAFRFVDFLHLAGCGVWQLLPLGPTGHARSPYSLVSAFAASSRLLPDDVLHGAAPDRRELANFVEREGGWLRDYALFTILKLRYGDAPWWHWPAEARDRKAGFMALQANRQAPAMAEVFRRQYLFSAHWEALRRYANDRGILMYGDLPMFPVADGADVWVNRHLFKLEPDGRASATAGVPPDLFAEDGQSWGNPVFDWVAMEAEGFRWWRERVGHELRRVDLLRWDHFRGLVATWEIPQEAKTARDGEWRDVPGGQLLAALRRDLGALPLIAENLGIITPEVEQLRRDFGLPGMHVFQFAFDGTQANPHLPRNHEKQGVAYTGTHDNDTTLGWFRLLAPEVRTAVLEETGGSEADMPWPAIRAVLRSPARLAVVPMQDYLSLGSAHRMNRPGIAEGNWLWQMAQRDLSERLAARIRESVEAAGR